MVTLRRTINYKSEDGTQCSLCATLVHDGKHNYEVKEIHSWRAGNDDLDVSALDGGDIAFAPIPFNEAPLSWEDAFVQTLPDKVKRD